MTQELKQFADQNQLLQPTDKILLAVSGGIDSVVLCHLFKTLGVNFGIAHVNYRLRGNESDEDATFVADLANNYGADFHIHTCSGEEFYQQKGESIQMIAREIRYRFFKEIKTKHGYHKIALAHHKNDLLETMLLNLSRGGGIASLHGILPSNKEIIRPLLCFNRRKIAKYAIDNQLKWREDASNSGTKYDRNWVRHEIVPQLERLNPSIEHTVAKTAKRLHNLELAWNKHAEELMLSKVIKEQFQCSRLKMEDLPQEIPAEAYLEYLFKNFNLNYQQIEEMASWRQHKQAGVLVENEAIKICLNKHAWVWREKKHQAMATEIEIGKTYDSGWATFTCFENPPINHEKSPNVFVLPKKAIEGKKMKLRTFQEGDKIKLQGMEGKKKISDLFTDLKVPLVARDIIPILEVDGEIVWVCGLRKSFESDVENHIQTIVFEWNEK